MPEQKSTTTTTSKMKASASAAAPVDDLLNTKLREMSVEERSDGLHDLHGVAENLPEETPEMLRTKVQDMNAALAAVCSKNSTTTDTSVDAYKQAVSIDPKYVERFKVPFLRAESYKSDKAAERMIRFFARKAELFGEEMLVKDITPQQCFDEEDRNALHAGVSQVLAHRDRVGRGIFLIHGRVNVNHSTKAVTKVFFYLVMAALQDEDTQKNGVVIIYYGNGQEKTIRDRPKASFLNSFALPWRISAVHFCGDKQSNPLVNLVAYGVCTHLENTLLCRVRKHSGTDLECIYNLMTFGIPKDVFPINADGSLDLTHHSAMLEMLKCREDKAIQKTHITGGASTSPNPSTSNSSPATISMESVAAPAPTTEDGGGGGDSVVLVLPGPMDIILGKGKHPKSSAGSLRMHNLLQQHEEEYEAAAKFDKTIIGDIILRKLELHGCRFLKPTTAGFEVCDESIARAKISHAFRNMRVKKVRKQQSAQNGKERKVSTSPLRRKNETTNNNNKSSKRERLQ